MSSEFCYFFQGSGPKKQLAALRNKILIPTVSLIELMTHQFLMGNRWSAVVFISWSPHVSLTKLILYLKVTLINKCCALEFLDCYDVVYAIIHNVCENHFDKLGLMRWDSSTIKSPQIFIMKQAVGITSVNIRLLIRYSLLAFQITMLFSVSEWQAIRLLNLGVPLPHLNKKNVVSEAGDILLYLVLCWKLTEADVWPGFIWKTMVPNSQLPIL